MSRIYKPWLIGPWLCVDKWELYMFNYSSNTHVHIAKGSIKYHSIIDF